MGGGRRDFRGHTHMCPGGQGWADPGRGGPCSPWSRGHTRGCLPPSTVGALCSGKHFWNILEPNSFPLNLVEAQTTFPANPLGNPTLRNPLGKSVSQSFKSPKYSGTKIFWNLREARCSGRSQVQTAKRFHQIVPEPPVFVTCFDTGVWSGRSCC